MDTLKIAGSNQPDMPWEDRPAGSKEVMWRYTQNPIIGRHALSTSNSIFNSAVVPFRKGKYNYAGVFRCDDTNRRMRIHVGFSVDGLRWEIEESDFRLEGADAEIGQWVYGYDPRVAKIGDKYYVTWCNGYHGPTIGIAWTDDFETFHQLENAFLPYNRNGVLFPRKIGGRFAMLSRPSDTGHTPFGDIFYSESPDMEFWGRHRHVMSPSAFEVSAWQCMKIGAGPVPIETSEGWLLFYHGVLRSCNGYVYAFGSALLDLENDGYPAPVRREHKEDKCRTRRMSPNYRLYAKDLCDWYSRDLKCYQLCKQTKSFIGVADKADFIALQEDLKFLQNCLKTTLKEYTEYFKARFIDGKSIRKYGEENGLNRGSVDYIQKKFITALAENLEQRDLSDGKIRIKE